jgi:hypothetical protein
MYVPICYGFTRWCMVLGMDIHAVTKIVNYYNNIRYTVSSRIIIIRSCGNTRKPYWPPRWVFALFYDNLLFSVSGSHTDACSRRVKIKKKKKKTKKNRAKKRPKTNAAYEKRTTAEYVLRERFNCLLIGLCLSNRRRICHRRRAWEKREWERERKIKREREREKLCKQRSSFFARRIRFIFFLLILYFSLSPPSCLLINRKLKTRPTLQD